ncbi:hypothetical protein [Bradyrhizobium sp. McL0616]|uniref:hypothetical protein n=1 Tax=Bradyrhizobium sp. McL0616 TaxID=3415674 RepID=UPI003CF47DC8
MKALPSDSLMYGIPSRLQMNGSLLVELAAIRMGIPAAIKFAPMSANSQPAADLAKEKRYLSEAIAQEDRRITSLDL